MENLKRINELRKLGFFIPETIDEVGEKTDSAELKADILKNRRIRLPELNVGDTVTVKSLSGRNKGRDWTIKNIFQNVNSIFFYEISPVSVPVHQRETTCHIFDNRIKKQIND